MMIRKRDGRVVEFDETKITDAIFEAAKSVGGCRQAAGNGIDFECFKILKK